MGFLGFSGCNDSANLKFGFVGELGLCTFLSLSKEKYQKNATQGRHPRYLPWESIPLISAPFRFCEMALRAIRSQFAIEPNCRRSADNSVGRPFGNNPRVSVIRQKTSDLGLQQSGESVRGFGSCRPFAQSDSFAYWRKSRAR